MVDWVGSRLEGESEADFLARKARRNKKGLRRSKHEGHAGFRRINGRVYCGLCDSLRAKAQREYQRRYQAMRRREAGAPVKADGSEQWKKFLALPIYGAYTVEELATEAELSENTIRGWIKKGWLEATTTYNDTGRGSWRKRNLVLL